LFQGEKRDIFSLFQKVRRFCKKKNQQQNIANNVGGGEVVLFMGGDFFLSKLRTRKLRGKKEKKRGKN